MSLIRKRRVGAAGAATTGSSGTGAGSVNRTSGADLSHLDQSVAVIFDKVSGHHLFAIGTRFGDLAVVIPPSLVSMA